VFLLKYWNTDMLENVCVLIRYVGQYIGHEYGPGSGQISMSDVECAGHETNISECGHVAWGTHRCDHSHDVSVSCMFDSAEQFAGRNMFNVKSYKKYT